MTLIREAEQTGTEMSVDEVSPPCGKSIHVGSQSLRMSAKQSRPVIEVINADHYDTGTFSDSRHLIQKDREYSGRESLEHRQELRAKICLLLNLF